MWFRTSGQANQTKQSTKLSKHYLTLHLRYCFCFAPPFKLLSHNHQHPKELPSCSSFLHTRTQHPKHHHHATTTRTPSQVKERREKKVEPKKTIYRHTLLAAFSPVTKNATYAVPRGTLSRTHATRTPNWRHSRREGTKCTEKRTKLFFFSLTKHARLLLASRREILMAAWEAVPVGF